MKYIKLYEWYPKPKGKDMYWELTLKQPYFKIALRKIGMPLVKIKVLSDKFMDVDDKIFIAKYHEMVFDELKNEYDEVVSWDYEFFSNKFRSDIIFMGKVKVEDWEINAEKYNL